MKRFAPDINLAKPPPPPPKKNPTQTHSHRAHTYIGIIRLTHLLLGMLTVSPCPDLLHTVPPSQLFFPPFPRPRFAISHPPPFRYRARGSLLLLSAALHSLCALRIHDAKVRSANGFNGAPTASALPGNRRIRRCIKFTLQQPTKTLI